MSKSYEADSIEVLEGLEPVKKRPGMYTDTTRPNHLAQEVIDNSVDEALEGFATEICVTLRKDGSMSVSDNGRGMPVDIHKKEKWFRLFIYKMRKFYLFSCIFQKKRFYLKVLFAKS